MDFVDDKSLLRDAIVLVVDDDPDSCELLTEILEMYGAKVVACHSVTEALTVFAQIQLHAIISDIAMPHQDGYALIEAIRSLSTEQGGQIPEISKEACRIPAIVFSAMAGEEDQRQALGAGFDRYLTKPLGFVNVVPALIELLQERAL
jgi:CheY-like chemotaxis protein